MRRKDRSMTDTQVKVAIVTGASGGIGRAVALRLARDGFRVVLNYAGNAGHAEAAAAEIKAAGGHAFAVQADVADAAAVERLFQETLGAFGRIDVVVNSAGIMPMGPIAEGSLEAFDQVIATNLRGSFVVMAQAAKHVGKDGRIIMFSSSVIAKSFPGYGALAARALARAGHTVYASMRETAGRNAPQVAEAQKYAAKHNVDLRTIDLDVASEASADAAIEAIVTAHGRLDVVIHNAGHMVFGPAEAFTPEQFAELYDVNVLSTQRVNRAALPQLRRQGQGLVIWVSSSSSAGGTPPYLAPYFAAKAAMDALAVVYARELTRWGIETSIIVPGAFTGGTNHFAHAGSPAHKARVAEYEAGPYKGFANEVREGFASIVPANADVAAVADAIVKVVDTPFGERPFRVHIDPTQDGADVVNMVSDRVRAELLRRIGLGDLLAPRDLTTELQSAA